MKAISSLTGFLLLVQGILGGFLMAGGNPLCLIQVPVFCIVFSGSLGAVVLAFGWERVWRTVTAAQFFFYAPKADVLLSDRITVLKAWIVATYAFAGLGALLGLVITMAYAGGAMVEICHHVACCIVGLCWGILFSECFFRPLKHRLEALEEQRRVLAGAEVLREASPVIAGRQE